MSTSVELRAAFSPTTADRGATLESIGMSVLRYALVLIFVLFGALKFTAAGAAAVKSLVSNSPLMRWLPVLLPDHGVSPMIGTTQLVPALLLPARPPSARAAPPARA